MKFTPFAPVVLAAFLAVPAQAAPAAAGSAVRPTPDRRSVEAARADAACTGFELVGFTQVETLPNVGVFGMTRLCAAQYPGSRMCTLTEALGTVVPPASLTFIPAAWIRDESRMRQPSAVKSPSEPNDDGDDAPPAVAPENDQCLGWAATHGWATTVSSDGAIAVRSCDQTAPIACCAPGR